MEYTIHGLKKGESRNYMESLLFTTSDQSKINGYINMAKSHGYHSFRVTPVNMAIRPNFAKTLNT